MSDSVLLRNGRIVDGTGAPWRAGSIRIENGIIVAVGGGAEGTADEIVDVEGAIVAPGFIDIHTHSDFTLPINREAHSKVRQGVTLEVVGNCGASAAPRRGEAAELVDSWFERNGLGDEVEVDRWRSVEEYLTFLQDGELSVNVATLLGHANVRAEVLGFEDREPSADELDRMRGIVADAMDGGAVGLSTGLFYPPGAYAATDEVVALAEPVADRGGIYTTHMRSESDELVASVEESIEIGREADVPVQISHHKAIGPDNWGKVRYTLRRMEIAREREGVDVQCDQYPYVASSTSLGALLPTWAHDGGDDALLERLRDGPTREALLDELRGSRTDSWDGVLITRVRNEDLEDLEGRTLAELADRDGEDRTPPEILLDVLLADENGTMHVNFGMDEDDVRTVMRHPLTMVGSDGSSLCTCGPLGEGTPHPRNYGAFPRVLGTYVREEGVLELEDAVYKMTGLPASRLSLSDRGRLVAGHRADVTVFDPDTVAQRGGFVNPHAYAAGIDHVLVNGEFVVRDGDHTGRTPGTVIGAE